MAGVRIVTDSACDLTQDEVEANGVRVVPLTIRFGADELTDRVELSAEEFYQRMAAADDLPETAAPAPGAFEEAFRACAADGADAVVCIDLSSQLSATMQSAENAARAVGDDLDVRVVDSRSISAGLGTIVLRAAEAAAGGASADDVVALVEDLARRTRVIATLDTLDNLKKGGRIGGAQAMLGSMLSVKPAIDISTGVVEQAGKPRTRRKGLEWLRDRLFEEPEVDGLCIAHGLAPDLEAFESMIAARYPAGTYRTATIGAVIGTHGGPRIMGLTYLVP